MFPAANYDIYADRYAPHSDYIDVIGYDFTGATFKMQVRDTFNGGTVRADIVPTLVVLTIDSTPTSRVSWTVDEATMEAMPMGGNDPEKDVTLYYDLHIDPSGADAKFVAWRGKFIVQAGVTQ